MVGQYRSIFLTEAFTKTWHGLLRTSVLRPLASSLEDSQLGCFPRQSAIFACHIVKTFEKVCRRSGQSSATLFLDVANAYYSVLREVVFGCHDMRSLNTLLCKVGMGALQREEVQSLIANIDPFAAAPMDVPTQCKLKEAFSHTWFGFDPPVHDKSLDTGARLSACVAGCESLGWSS